MWDLPSRNGEGCRGIFLKAPQAAPLTCNHLQMKIFSAVSEVRMGSCYSKRARHSNLSDLFNFSQRFFVKLYKIQECGSRKWEAWSKQRWGKAGERKIRFQGPFTAQFLTSSMEAKRGFVFTWHFSLTIRRNLSRGAFSLGHWPCDCEEQKDFVLICLISTDWQQQKGTEE